MIDFDNDAELNEIVDPKYGYTMTETKAKIASYAHKKALLARRNEHHHIAKEILTVNDRAALHPATKKKLMARFKELNDEIKPPVEENIG